LASTSQTAQAAQFKVGQKFPGFTLRTIDGKVVSSASLKNKPFWMTFFHSG
jgi:peroxiredoxin